MGEIHSAVSWQEDTFATGSYLAYIKGPTEASRFIYENTSEAATAFCAVSFGLFSGQSLNEAGNCPLKKKNSFYWSPDETEQNPWLWFGRLHINSTGV